MDRNLARFSLMDSKFSGQESLRGLSCPSPRDLPDPGIEPRSPVLQADSLLSEPQGSQVESAHQVHSQMNKAGPSGDRHSNVTMRISGIEVRGHVLPPTGEGAGRGTGVLCPQTSGWEATGSASEVQSRGTVTCGPLRMLPRGESQGKLE